MKKTHDWLSNKKILMLLSLLISVAAWFIVATLVRPTGELEVSGVPVNINVQASVIGQMGLNVLEGGETSVKVLISGRRSVIGGIAPEDISVTASLAGVSGAGTYELDLIAENQSDEEFDILTVTPSKMTVKFDRLVDKVIPVTYQLEGEFEVPEGYIRETVQLDPAEVVITGPENDIASITQCVATATFEGVLEHTTTVEAPLRFLNRNDRPVQIDEGLTSVSHTTAEVTLPLLKTKELPLRFEYLQVPDGLPIEELEYTLSNETIEVAGPTVTVDTYRDLMIGYVDLRDVTLDHAEVFTVPMPEGFINTGNIESVQLNFNMEGFVEQTLTTRNFVVVNTPAPYEVEVTTQQLSVNLVGPEEILSGLTGDDIVVEIDISDREIQPGQYQVAFRVSVPNKGLVWATGSYSGIIVVQDQD